MTINGLFIYFLIPVFSAFSHIYSQNLKNKKIFINFFLTLSIISTIYYNQKYISKRDTLILRDADLNKSVDASVLSNKLKNLRWLTHHYPENPNQEIKNLKDDLNQFQQDQNDAAVNRRKRGRLDSNVEHICGDFLNLEFPKNHFNIVVSWLALYHIPNRKKLLQKCINFLKPNGYFFGEDFACYKPFSENEKLSHINHSLSLYFISFVWSIR